MYLNYSYENIKYNNHEFEVKQILFEAVKGVLDLTKYSNINIIICESQNIKSIINYPPQLIKLYCNNNKIVSINNLPETLEELYCYNNEIIKLDNLPSKLKILSCFTNKIESLDNLPNSLEKLYCPYNYKLKY